jgi:phosphate transport system permease protein
MIANQFADADPGLFTSSLLALGFILFIITFVVLALARWMLSRLEVKAGR